MNVDPDTLAVIGIFFGGGIAAAVAGIMVIRACFATYDLVDGKLTAVGGNRVGVVLGGVLAAAGTLTMFLSLGWFTGGLIGAVMVGCVIVALAAAVAVYMAISEARDRRRSAEWATRKSRAESRGNEHRRGCVHPVPPLSG
ncbi:hypothetical protein [Leifsonia shinshuensis]